MLLTLKATDTPGIYELQSSINCSWVKPGQSEDGTELRVPASAIPVPEELAKYGDWADVIEQGALVRKFEFTPNSAKRKA